MVIYGFLFYLIQSLQQMKLRRGVKESHYCKHKDSEDYELQSLYGGLDIFHRFLEEGVFISLTFSSLLQNAFVTHGA